MPQPTNDKPSLWKKLKQVRRNRRVAPNQSASVLSASIIEQRSSSEARKAEAPQLSPQVLSIHRDDTKLRHKCELAIDDGAEVSSIEFRDKDRSESSLATKSKHRKSSVEMVRVPIHAEESFKRRNPDENDTFNQSKRARLNVGRSEHTMGQNQASGMEDDENDTVMMRRTKPVLGIDAIQSTLTVNAHLAMENERLRSRCSGLQAVVREWNDRYNSLKRAYRGLWSEFRDHQEKTLLSFSAKAEELVKHQDPRLSFGDEESDASLVEIDRVVNSPEESKTIALKGTRNLVNNRSSALTGLSPRTEQEKNGAMATTVSHKKRKEVSRDINCEHRSPSENGSGSVSDKTENLPKLEPTENVQLLQWLPTQKHTVPGETEQTSTRGSIEHTSQRGGEGEQNASSEPGSPRIDHLREAVGLSQWSPTQSQADSSSQSSSPSEIMDQPYHNQDARRITLDMEKKPVGSQNDGCEELPFQRTSTNSTASSEPWISNEPSRRFINELRKNARPQSPGDPRLVRKVRKRIDSDLEINPDVPPIQHSPVFKYCEVVRGKDKRQQLPCHDCAECRAFYASINPDGDLITQNPIQFSRHRAQFTPPETPADFWEIEFIDEKRAAEAREKS